MMGSMELKPAERNTETMKDVERNLLRESCRKKPVEREIVARESTSVFCVYTRHAQKAKPDTNEKAKPDTNEKRQYQQHRII